MKFDINNQLINNTYIFKENLKIIALKIGIINKLIRFGVIKLNQTKFKRP